MKVLLMNYDEGAPLSWMPSGPASRRSNPCDAVVARADGAYAQYVLASLDSVVLKPSSFTFEQAAGIPVAGIA